MCWQWCAEYGSTFNVEQHDRKRLRADALVVVVAATLNSVALRTNNVTCRRRSARRAVEVHATMTHLDSDFKEIVEAFAVPLRLFPRVTPHVHAVATDEHGARLGVVGDGFAEAVGQLVLPRSVFDDGNSQLVEVTVPIDALDHFLMRDAEFRLTFEQGGNDVAANGVAMQNCTRISLLECMQEQRGAVRQLRETTSWLLFWG